MKPILGLSRDTAPNDQRPGTYRHAENILLTKLNQAVATEPGNTAEYNKSGYDLVGVIPVRDDAAVLFYVEDDYLTDSSYLSEIVYLDGKGNATLILQHADLNFNPANTFKGVHYYNPSDELVVAWTDNNNPPRILNIDNPEFTGTTPGNKYIKRLAIFPDASVPSVKGVITADEAGSIANGAYTFFITYEANNDVVTNYLGGYGSYLVGTGRDIEGVSSVGISLDFQNLDTDYDFVRIYAVKTTGSTKTGIYLSRLEIPNTGSLVYNWSGKKLGDVVYEDMIINNASYTTAKTLTVLNDRLHLANLGTDNFFDYQPYANSIEAEWTFEQDLNNVASGQNNIDAEEYGSYRGFMPGATYAFYISFILNDGTYSPAFHIPGRVSTDSTVYDNIISGNPLRKIDVNDYSGYNSTTVSESDDHADSNYTFYYGDMGYHQNETETYPNTDTWRAKYVQGTYNSSKDLRGEKVRHHKFPSIQKLAANISNFNKFEVVFGVRFNNIAIPSALLDIVKGYTIFYAARDFGNMDVITYVPVIDNEFQATANWNVTSQANPTCTSSAASGQCTEWKLINESYQDIAVIQYANCDGIEVEQTLYEGQHLTVYGLKDTNAPDGNLGTVVYGSIDINEIGLFNGGGTFTNSCDSATLKNGKLRIYDPMILAKKPSLSNLFVMPEWYNNNPWKNTSNTLLNAQHPWASDLGSIEYLPANNSAVNNMEREEAALLITSNIIAGDHQGIASRLRNGINGYIGNHIMLGSLRQYIPNIYAGFDNQLLASTSVVFDLTNPTPSDTFISGSGNNLYARTPRIYGGDVTLERITVQYMTNEDYLNTNMVELDPNDSTVATEVHSLNNQNYTYFLDNAENNSVRRFSYVTPSRLPLSKMYGDPGLEPVLTSKVVKTYGGEYLNQYLINPAYETINTTKPAFPYSSIALTPQNTFPTRIARSVVQQSESEDLQWRTFRSTDYYEHSRTKGSITNIEEYNGELLIHHEQSLFKTIGKEKLGATATDIYLGTGDIFNLPPRELIDTPQGYAGTQHLGASLLSKAGYFFLDLEQRKVFTVGAELNEISNKGMRNWFRDNLEFDLKAQLEGKGINNRYTLYDAPAHSHGCGFTVAYDDEYNRYVLAKKSWKFTTDGLAKVRTESQHNDPIGYTAGKIYFVNNIPQLAVVDNSVVVLQPLDMTSDDVEFDSWTVSYSPATDSWISFHDYKPSLLWATRNNFYSFTDQIYKHNNGAVGTFYGSTHPSLIDLVFNPDPNRSKVFFNFNWITESINTSGGSVKKDTFTHATVYNSYQLSSRVTLTNHTNTTGSLRDTEGTWYFNTFRDKLTTQNADIVSEDGTINYSLLNNSLEWFKQRRFIDKYSIIRLEYDNSSGNTLYLYEASAAVRVSNR